MELCVDEFTIWFFTRWFLRRSAGNTVLDATWKIQKCELKLHPFEGKYEKFTIALMDGMMLRNARMTHTHKTWCEVNVQMLSLWHETFQNLLSSGPLGTKQRELWLFLHKNTLFEDIIEVKWTDEITAEKSHSDMLRFASHLRCWSCSCMDAVHPKFYLNISRGKFKKTKTRKQWNIFGAPSCRLQFQFPSLLAD